ncbi:hypothetical protein LRAMOSA02692 [Lichtheimia ramosa]|uniref:HMG box domain-containing protein n=1 Tax=Lichtheimia ramosa TaxID=688394 RepID=A0A077WQX2_9FUNG|nr:hypothetical protein LRAMOSA02692 [Lichtheimia ramosa]
MGSVHDTTSLQLPVNTSSLGDSGNFDFHASVTSNNIDSTDFGFEYDNTETLAQRVIQQTSTALTSMPTHHNNDTMSTTTSSAMSSQFQHSINNSEDVTSTMNITTPCIDEQHAKYTSYEQHVHSNEDDTMNMQQYASKATGIFGSNVITEHQQHPKTYAESSSSSRAVMAPHHHLPTILAPILSFNSSSNSASDTTLSNSALPRDTNKIHHDTCIHYTDDKDDKATWVFASKKGQENDQYLLFSVDHSKQELSMSHQAPRSRKGSNSSTSSSNSSNRAIIINMQEEKYPNKRSFQEMSTDSNNTIRRVQLPGLQHIVSPYAIREAERQEEEEALGKIPEHPFKAYPSFISMKHMHEQNDRRSNNDTSSSTSPPSLSIPTDFSIRGDDDDDDDDDDDTDDAAITTNEISSGEPHTPRISSSPITFCSCNQQDATTSTTVHHQSSSRLNVASRLGAAEANALNDIGRLKSTAPPPPLRAERERLKRPPNAYLLFNRDMRRRLLQISPKMGVAEISRKIGEKWKQLPSEQREKYIQEAALIKQDHLKNHPDFIYTRRSKAELAEAKRLSKLRRSSSSKKNDTPSSSEEKTVAAKEQQQQQRIKRRRKSNAPDAPRDPRGRKKKRHRHPTAPKHPMSPFLFFLAAVRPHVAQQFPGSTVGPISKVIGAQWRDMSDEERIPWIQMAEEDKARYAREMRVYMANLDQQAHNQDVTDATSNTEDLDDTAVATVVQMVNRGSEQDFYPPTTDDSSSSSNHFEAIFPQSSECI